MKQLLVRNKYGKVMSVVDIDERVTIEVPNVNNSIHNVTIHGKPNLTLNSELPVHVRDSYLIEVIERN